MYKYVYLIGDLLVVFQHFFLCLFQMYILTKQDTVVIFIYPYAESKIHLNIENLLIGTNYHQLFSSQHFILLKNI